MRANPESISSEGTECRVPAWGNLLMTRPHPVLRTIGVVCVFAVCLQAQQGTSTTQESENQKSKQSEHNSKRVAGVIPAFNSEDDVYAPALSSSEKFHLFTKTVKDPYNLIMPAINAVILNAAGASSGYGSGAAGFGKRYGAAILDSISGNFFRLYAFPSLLHEDPRYFRAGREKSFGRRCKHVFGATLETRKDDGTFRFNWSKLLASTTSSGLSNAYYPAENRGTKLTLSRIGLSYLGEIGYNSLKEFLPDIKRKK
jgi:hypothetical protein